jgi:hypothetical protein
MKCSIILCCILILVQNSKAQTMQEAISNWIENNRDEAESADEFQVISDLEQYYNHPLDLNSTNYNDISTAPFLSGFQKAEILLHRRKFGDFISIYELQQLSFFTPHNLRAVLPFIKVSKSSKKPSLKHGTHTVFSTFKITTPFSKAYNSSFFGNPLYANLRYRYTLSNRITWGITLEKDPGEPFFRGINKYGFDYNSWYLSVKDLKWADALYLGNFQANFGQGLTLSTGYALGKSSILTSCKRNFYGFDTYRSLRENAFLNGLAIAFNKPKHQYGLFVSYKKTDATKTDSLNEVSNIQEYGGYHRTQSELNNKDATSDFQTGCYFQYKIRKLKIGAIGTFRQLEHAVTKPTKLYKKFYFSGDQYFKTGIYYDLLHKNMNFFGELTQNSNNSFSQSHGLIISVGKILDLSLLARSYSLSNISYQLNGFGENSSNSNEKGLYSGFNLALSNRLHFTGQLDIYKHPWLRYKVSAPSIGNDIWLELKHQNSRSFSWYYRFRQKNTLKDNISTLHKVTKNIHRVHLKYKPSKQVEFRNRLEWNSVSSNNSSSKGNVITQDIIYNPAKLPASFSLRLSSGSLDGYDNRIYSYERVPLYSYPLFNHSFSGIRSYILVSYRFRNKLKCWVKIAASQYNIYTTSLLPEHTIGLGTNEIQGNIKKTFNLQLKYTIE